MAWWLDVSGHIHTMVDRSQGGLGHCCQSWRRLSIPPLSGQWGSNGRVFSENSAGVCGRSVLDVSLITVTYWNCQFFVRFILGVAGEWWFHFSGTTCHKVISKIVYWSDFHMFLFQCFSWKLLKTKQLRINGSNLATAMMLHNASPWKPVESGVRSLARPGNFIIFQRGRSTTRYLVYNIVILYIYVFSNYKYINIIYIYIYVYIYIYIYMYIWRNHIPVPGQTLGCALMGMPELTYIYIYNYVYYIYILDIIRHSYIV